MHAYHGRYVFASLIKIGQLPRKSSVFRENELNEAAP